MTLQFFIQGDNKDEWWYVTDKNEYDAMKRLYSFYEAYKYGPHDAIERIEYQMTVNNQTTDYVVALKLIVPEHFGQGNYMQFEMYKYRKQNPVNVRKIEVIKLSSHEGIHHNKLLYELSK